MAWSVLALTLGGSSLLYLLIQRGAATEVTSLLYLVPPCTALMAWLAVRRSAHAEHVARPGADCAGVRCVARAARASGVHGMRLSSGVSTMRECG